MAEELSQLELLNNDSMNGLNNVYRQMSVVQNNTSGIGTARDPSTHAQIVSVDPLTRQECEDLFINSQIARNIVSVYPEEATWLQVSYGTNKYATYGLESESVKTYLANLRTGSLEQKFREVSIEARLHGEAYLLLGINDGQPFTKPVNEQAIQSFDWVEVFIDDEVERIGNDLYRLTIRANQHDSNAEVDGVSLNSVNGVNSSYVGLDKTVVVHRSRLLKFIGDYNPPSVRRRIRKHQSVLQAAYSGLITYLQGLAASNAMLNDYSLFWYKLNGLSQLVKLKQYDEIYNRFLTLQMSKSVLKGIAMDSNNEDAGFIQRSYGGVKDILDAMTDNMVAETGMVRFKVLGTANRAGLGAEGRGLQDRLEHSLKMRSWQKFVWYDNAMYCVKICLQAQNSPTRGKLPKGLDIQFPPSLELDPSEIADLFAKNVGWVKTAIDAGLISELEGRLSIFSESGILLNPSINLDERVTQKMELELEKKLEQANNPSPPVMSPNNQNNLNDPNANPSVNPNANNVNANVSANNVNANNLNPSELEQLLKLSQKEEDLSWYILPDLKNVDLQIDADQVTNEDETYYHFLVWFSGKNGTNKHRTPIAVGVTGKNYNDALGKAKTLARSKCQRYCDEIYATRQATESEKKTAKSGGWIRTGAQGQKAGYSGIKGVGRQMKDSEDVPDNGIDPITEATVKRITKALKLLAVVRSEDVNTEAN